MSYGSTPPPPPPTSPPQGSSPELTTAGSPPLFGAGQSPYGPLATWSTRAVGYVIDYSLLLPGYLVMWLSRPKTVTVITHDRAIVHETSPLSTWYFVGLLLVFGVLFWNRWLNGGKGQTLGRRVMGTTLINEQGRPIGTFKAFLRDVAHIIDSLIFYIGWLFPIWDAKRQTIADKIMTTFVIVVPKT